MSIGKSSISRAEKAVSKNKATSGGAEKPSASAVFAVGGEVLQETAAPKSSKKAAKASGNITTVEVSKISSTYSESSITCGVLWKELLTSVEKHGIIEPLVLRKLGTSYRVIAGHKRLFAAKKLGIKEVEAKIIEADDETFAAIVSELVKFTPDSAYYAKEKAVAEASRSTLPDYLL